MPVFSKFPAPAPARRSAWALLAVAALALSACGGGGSDGDDDPPVPMPQPEPLPRSIDTLAGEWVQKGCVRAGGQSFKKLLQARVTSPTTLDYSEGVLSFAGNDCAGTSQRAGPSPLGVVTFARAESDSALAAHWGELRTVTGTRHGAIWTLRPANLLCLLGDQIPSNQPTLSAVAASVTTIPADNCFAR